MRLYLLLALLLLTACSTIPEMPYHSRGNSYQKNIYHTSNGWNAYQEGYKQSAVPNKINNKPTYVVLEYFVGKNAAKFTRKNQVQLAINTLDIGAPNTYLYVFVHGWNSNALDCFNKDSQGNQFKDTYEQCVKARGTSSDEVNYYYDNNALEVFQTLLYKRQLEMNRAGLGHIKVKGIYVGWHGRETNNIVNELLTIRKTADTAIKVGENTSLGEDLQKLSNKLAPSSRMAVMGHSFGAKVLTGAMLKIADPKKYENCYTPLGKQAYILTINPAIEAAAFNNMYNRSNYERKTSICDSPNWINITSKNDYYTFIGYPLGSFLFGISKFGSALMGNWKSIGQNTSYLTHNFDIENYSHTNEIYANQSLYSPYFAPPAKFKGEKALNQLPITHLSHFRNFLNAPQKNYPDGNSCGFYPVIFPKTKGDNKAIYLFSYKRLSLANSAKIWNIATDKSVISAEKNSLDSIFNVSLHTAFSQTNPLRMIDAIVWKEKLAPSKKPSEKVILLENNAALNSIMATVTKQDAYKKQLENCISK